MATKTYEWFEIDWPAQYKPGKWIGVKASGPRQLPYPFDIRLCYSDTGELLCEGLCIGEGAGNRLMRFPWPVPVGENPPRDFPSLGVPQKPKSNVTARMLAKIPLGAVLRFIQESGVSDPAVRDNLQRLDLPIAAPFEGLPATPGAKRKDDFYIQQAKKFAHERDLLAKDRPASSRDAEAYRRLAATTGWAESTIRSQVHRGWELQPDLKPQGVRTRRAKSKEKP